ncbi:thiamine-phosphate kinase [Aphanizomenon flos-aquae NRERC-008]|jgi:thiamine-monophosphate kinase|uniref:Thiamine-monophosphate kinase n=2 Tax=Aphanizomenon flos-aquae TaxID=1176 RepID=A0A1B7X3E8_APHFL|nr:MULTISPECIES: thiamine-phosphate kinase [Aphanizomenon]MBO1063055.1 thiamine-phosphate kinase [Aphanizomenon flos-aquae CP01]MCE2905615.1 thiamine-phosphate kinase [Anabaena sp. CoA2_C59]MDJ0505330.1 thiamine-phosphate kinase [Nostocales cyanobacterium LE14-WE12]NTW18348.1 thiamine-phosphate kinase [Nostocales cyanobacterium W4_Combined_metabat2_030]OBQ24604.1 MAG: thiamine monophosphate kinase [Anabaena sp. WA113]OBQ43921.1 MAG: thiamine monophosphate kinase [Aphanizomenon flos-aquae WA10
MDHNLSSLRVRDIGEQGLLEKLQHFCPPGIIGDDGAVLATESNKCLIVTTDMLVEGVHFSDVTTSPQDAGWRAAAANLSDLAAMGATPLGITVGLGLPGDVTVSWVEQLYQGMTECLSKYHTNIVGGDIVRSPITTLAITVFGQVDPNLIIRRGTAQVGNAIVITGIHGASRAGLELLLHPEIAQNLKTEAKTALITAHQRPNPRLDVLPILWEILENQSKTQNLNSQITVAGMDSSDGLADAILQICRASQVGAIIESSQIPFSWAFAEWLTSEKSLEYALYGGEDFELVLCLPPEPALTLVQKLGQGAAIIGTITPTSTVILHDKQAEIPDQILSFSRGFQHFG